MCVLEIISLNSFHWNILLPENHTHIYKTNNPCLKNTSFYSQHAPGRSQFIANWWGKSCTYEPYFSPIKICQKNNEQGQLLFYKSYIHLAIGRSLQCYSYLNQLGHYLI
jgi:hypothetical protein